MTKKQRERRGKPQAGMSTMDIKGEIAHIIARARAGDPRLVSLGPLVFFSTESGDAWMLDAEDDCAMCLALSGVPQPANIVETDQSDAVEWDRWFHIEGTKFTTVDSSGRIATIMGYPTDAILAALRREEGQSGPG